jgi:serine/threonine protein kinase
MSEEELPSYGEKADVWSLGCVVLEAVTGCQPFQGDSVREMQAVHTAAFEEKSAYGGPSLLSRYNLSPSMQNFLGDMLTPDPDMRPSVYELLARPELQELLGYSAEQTLNPQMAFVDSEAEPMDILSSIQSI